MTEWLIVFDCKSNSFRFVGSNPTLLKKYIIFYCMGILVKEIQIRIGYLILSFICTIFIILVRKNQFLFILTIPFLQLYTFSVEWQLFFFNPVDAFNVSCYLCLVCGFFLVFPLFFYHVYCFFATSWYFYEHLFFLFCFSLFHFQFFITFKLLLCWFLPNLWYIIVKISSSFTTELFEMYLIPNTINFLKFTLQFSIASLILFQLPLLYFFLIYQGYLNYYNLVELRQFSYSFNIFLATIFSSPDLLSQILIFSLLIFIYEIIILWVSFYINIKIIN